MNRLWLAIVIPCLLAAGLWALRAHSHRPALPEGKGTQSSKAPAGSQTPVSSSTQPQSASPEMRPPDAAAKPKPDPQVLLERIRSSNISVEGSGDDHEKATAWLALQEAEEELISVLPNAPGDACYDPHSSRVLLGCPGRETIEEAQRLGADISYCGAGESWLEGTRGHEQYLKLWPDGPNADRAFWKTAVEPPCCDKCAPTKAEEIRNMGIDSDNIKNLIIAYSTFLQKFPNSTLKEDAELKLHEYENLLKKRESAEK